MTTMSMSFNASLGPSLTQVLVLPVFYAYFEKDVWFLLFPPIQTKFLMLSCYLYALGTSKTMVF